MNQPPAEVLSRVPTLTEVLQLPPMPDLADQPADGQVLRAQEEPATIVLVGGWVDQIMDRLSPQMDALMSSRFRDVLAPAIQDAVDQALERLREPLILEVQSRLREVLEAELQQFQGPSERVKPPP